jgi:glycosyltransferase 2 family protein
VFDFRLSFVAEDAAMKRTGIMLLQLFVTAAGLWYVFHDPQRRAQIAEALRHASISWVLLGWICYSAVEVLATVRWQILLRIQGITLNWLRALAIVMIGLFFNMFLPGLVGGDAVRLYFVFKCAPRKKTPATLSVAMDRILGMLAILLLAALSVAVRFRWLSHSGATLHIVYLVLGLLSAGCVCVLLLFSAVHFGLLYKLPRRMPFRPAIIESAKALELYGTHFGLMIIAFAITVIAHVAYYLSFYCAAQSLHGTRTTTLCVTDVLSIMPLVNTVTALPISFGGVGVRETLFQELLGNLAHVPPAIAAISASLGFIIQASWGLLGAGAYLLSQRLMRR